MKPSSTPSDPQASPSARTDATAPTGQGRSKSLLELAEAHFGDELTAADRILFEQTAKGEPSNYGDGDPGEADQWRDERVLKADRIRWLCTDPEATKRVLPHEGIDIEGARIEGKLRLGYTKIGFPLSIKNSAIPDGIVMERARICALYLQGTHTGSINAGGLKVEHDLFMREGFRATGEVCLVHATIGGDLSCFEGHFSNPNLKALNADGIKVEGSVFLRHKFEATGEVRLLGATIGGNLECDDGHFSNHDGYALNADGIQVEGSVFLRNKFEATGEVNLVGATIGATLDCADGHFSNPNGKALYADRIKVEGSVFLRGNFTAEGVVDLTASRIRGFLHWRQVKEPQLCTLALESARVGTLWDEEDSWPEEVRLDGLVYDRIYHEALTDPGARLRWIKLQKADRYLPQPYEQLAKVLKEMGHEREARKILIAKARDPKRLKAMTSPRRFWHRVLGCTIDYGYRPWLAGWWVLGFLAIGSVVFAGGARMERFEQTKTGSCPKLNVMVYSADAFVPLIDLHQVKYWMPKPGAFRAYLWFHILAGWVLSTLLVVGLTGLVRG